MKYLLQYSTSVDVFDTVKCKMQISVSGSISLSGMPVELLLSVFIQQAKLHLGIYRLWTKSHRLYNGALWMQSAMSASM